MRADVRRWNPRFLAADAARAGMPPVLRLDALRAPEAAALCAAAARAGARAALGSGGALVAGTLAQHAALADALVGGTGRGAEEGTHAGSSGRSAGGARGLGRAIHAALAHQYGPSPAPSRVGTAAWAWGARTYVMAILNASPESFSGDGQPDVEALVRQARAFAAAGADVLDVGGESTRPGAPAVPAETERTRVLPVLRALRATVPLPLSIDTYKAEVAEAALDVGASIVNDVTGLRDRRLAAVAAARGAVLIVTHNRTARTARGPLGSHNVAVAYADLLGDVLRGLRGLIARAEAAGVTPAQVWIDPGIGFGKTREQNLALLARLGELRALGRPLLLGTSRKSVIGLTLSLPVDERAEGTAATVALGVRAGADVVRVHDVASMALVTRLADAVVRADGG